MSNISPIPASVQSAWATFLSTYVDASSGLLQINAPVCWDAQGKCNQYNGWGNFIGQFKSLTNPLSDLISKACDCHPQQSIVSCATGCISGNQLSFITQIFTLYPVITFGNSVGQGLSNSITQAAAQSGGIASAATVVALTNKALSSNNLVFPTVKSIPTN